MIRRVLIINGHPDPRRGRLCAALCDAYADGAREMGRDIRRLNLAALDIPILRTAEAFETGPVPPDALLAQEAITWADHIVFVHPLWLGSAPALFKVFCEQVFRYGFAVPAPDGDRMRGLLGGRSARLIVTMGMPALVYRLVFGAFGLRAFERGVLRLSGMAPVRRTLFGEVEGDARRRDRMLATVRRFGERGV